MKEDILKILETYGDNQANLTSEALREALADEICDDIKRKNIITPMEDAVDGTGWVRDGELD
jgi:hypothetical protein